MAPRFPTLFIADVGPLNAIAVLGTVLVTHAVDGSIRIGSLVPNPQAPTEAPARYVIPPLTDNPLARIYDPYSSLHVTTSAIYCLQPNGVLITSTPPLVPGKTL
jgi:hypothetical protein